MTDREPLTMIREDLEGIPSYPLPHGYSIQWHRPGDERHWLALQEPFYRAGYITPELFREQYGEDTGLMGSRLCYLVNETGLPIGTAAAWVYDGFRSPAYGRIHWVAIHQEYQGRGLSKPLLSVVCTRLQALGHTKAYLTTSWLRPVAIHLYRQFGFVELPANDPAALPDIPFG